MSSSRSTPSGRTPAPDGHRGLRGLRGLRARDVMQTDLLVLSPDANIRDAVATLEEYGVGGAPVVDVAGRLVGSFSVRDVARSEHVRSGRLDPGRNGFPAVGLDEERTGEEAWAVADELDAEDYGVATLGEEVVRDWMSEAPVAVLPGASLKAVCGTLLGEGIHRVLVVDRGRLVGLVSTTDVVRAVAQSL